MFRKITSILLVSLFLLSIFTPVQAQSADELPIYVVQPGDTLIRIAGLFGVSSEDIINANQLQNADFLSMGDSLRIPGLNGISGTLTTVTVSLGETLSSLAQANSTSPDFIVKINRLTSPYEVYAGASLIIPLSDTESVRSPLNVLEPGGSLLETAASLNENPWLLQEEGRFSTESIVPGIVFYGLPSDGQSAINIFDPSLTNVTITPLPLVQGQTYEIKVSSSLPVTLEGTLAGNKLVFFSNGVNQFTALQGIYAMARPGVSNFTLTGQYGNGKGFSISQPVLLVSGGYGKEAPLTVDPATLDPAVTNPEDDFIKNLASTQTPIRYWSGIFQSPAVYNEFTSEFGVRRSYNGSAYTYFHSGLDFAGGMGLPIKAPADGVVVFAGPLAVRGNVTFIDHGWGVYSGFFHQSEIKVKVGDKVKAGDIVGLVGNTGRVSNATDYPGAGAHLHWDVWVNGVQVNPKTWLAVEYP